MKLWLLCALTFLVLMLSGCQDDASEVALGTLERDRVVLTATASEMITQVLVREGQVVAEGELLLKLDDRRQSARVAQAEAGLQQANALLAELQNGVRPEQIAAAHARLEGATANATAATNQLQRVKTLFEQKLVGKAELDTAVAQRDAGRAAVKDAEEQWRLLLAGTRVEQLRQAEAQVAAAVAALSLERQALADLEIKASRAGRVDSLPWRQGDRVAAGALLAVLLIGDAPYARAYLPQRYRALLREGDRLSVRVDGLPDQLRGTVRWISAEPAFTPFYALNQKERTRLVYLVEVQLENGAADVPAGLPAQLLLPETAAGEE